MLWESSQEQHVPFTLAPSEICRRCGESAMSPVLKASIPARAFLLRQSEGDEVKIGGNLLG